jgi:hypothetical protein
MNFEELMSEIFSKVSQEHIKALCDLEALTEVHADDDQYERIVAFMDYLNTLLELRGVAS